MGIPACTHSLTVGILQQQKETAKATTPQSQQAKKIGKRKRDCLTTNKHL
jgi:hypothetical protein